MESIGRKLSLAALMCCGALVAFPAGAFAQGVEAKDGCRDGVREGSDNVFDNNVISCGDRGRHNGRNNRNCFRFDSRNRRDRCRDHRGGNRRHNGNRNNRFNRRHNGNRRCDNFDRRGRRRQCRNNNGRRCGKFDHRNRRQNCRDGSGARRADANVSRINGNRVRA